MNVARDFTRRLLPWIVGGAALLIFLITLNGWLSLPTLGLMAQLKGWDPTPLYAQPLYYLLTWPIRLLSGTTENLGLNLFSAVCGALTIALLARSVALLPQDRTREQRQREPGENALLSIPLRWLPPVFAGLALALQLTFWENATTPGGEMLDLLLFAYCVRCLLEFRVTQNEFWLAKLALVYGLGITNNWAMIGFFPLFVIALVWIKGLSFFKGKFILRMVAYGLIGLSLYLFLPLVHMISGKSDLGFFEILRENWRYQKNYILVLPFISAPTLRAHLFMLSLTSIIPLLLIGIRWKTFRGETNAAAGMLTAAMFRLMHIALLVVCAWVFFDPKFSGRLLGFGMLPFLSFYFLSALAVGYLLGYVLLVFGVEPDQKWQKSGGVLSILNKVVFGLAVLATVAVPIGLVAKNWNPIRASNGSLLPNYATRLIENLPAKKSILIADDPTQLLLVEAAYERKKVANPHILLSSAGIGDPGYRKQLERKHRELSSLFKLAENVTLSDMDKVLLLHRLTETFSLQYLHPSFGFFFENFYAVPHGLSRELRPIDRNQMLPSPLPAEVVAENEKFWNVVKSDELGAFRKATEESRVVTWVGGSYSRALNAWAVQLQKQNRLKEAEANFTAALQFSPDNVVAEINRRFNQTLQAGKPEPVAISPDIEKKLTELGLVNAMNLYGPFDELGLNLALGELFAVGNNLRQAAQHFLRVLEITPNDPRARIGMAMTYLDAGQPGKALDELQTIRTNPRISLNEAQKLQLVRLETLCYVSQKEITKAEQVLTNARQEFPRNEAVTKLFAEFYLQAAVIEINSKQYQAALNHLNALLKIAPNDPHGLFNRALAYLQMNRLDDSKRDFLKVEQILTESSHRVHFGLAEIAMRQKDTQEAIKRYEAYLESAPKDTPEYKEVQGKLQTLRSGQ